MKQMILSVVLTIFIITGSITFTLNFRILYYHDITALKIEQTSGLSRKTICENYNSLIDYNSVFSREPLKLTMKMSKEGRIHFQEVRKIFYAVQILLGISFLCSLFLGFRQMKQKNYHFLKTTSILTLTIPLITGVTVSLFWNKAFVLFHKLLFSNDYWIFDPCFDPIINILPDTFFFHCTVMIILLILAGSGTCFLLYKFCSFFRHKSMI